MSSQQVMKYCRRCANSTIHVGPGTSHVLHFLLSLVTVGIWLPIWFLVHISNASQMKCGQCGGRGPRASETHVRCPDCKELVLAEANKCKHCGTKLVV